MFEKKIECYKKIKGVKQKKKKKKKKIKRQNRNACDLPSNFFETGTTENLRTNQITAIVENYCNILLVYLKFILPW